MTRFAFVHVPRRKLLKAFGFGATLSVLPGLTFAASAERRKLGLLIPPTGGTLPGEAASMYSAQVEYLIETLGLDAMTPEAYDLVLERIAPNAQKLAARGAEAIVLMGTSLSFYQGRAFNEQLTRNLIDATGLPSMTMSSAVIEGLKRVGAGKVVVATAYNDEVNARLRTFLSEHDFDVRAVRGLDIEAMNDLAAVTPAQLIDFGSEVAALAPEADAMLVSCGGLPTLEILAPLEARTGIPAVSSTPHALWAGARLLGIDSRIPGQGRLLST